MPTDAQPMPRPTRSGLKVLAVGVLIVAPVLYVLGEGPIAYLTFRGKGVVPVDVYRVAFSPLARVSAACEPVRHNRSRYLSYWLTRYELRCYTDCGEP